MTANHTYHAQRIREILEGNDLTLDAFAAANVALDALVAAVEAAAERDKTQMQWVGAANDRALAAEQRADQAEQRVEVLEVMDMTATAEHMTGWYRFEKERADAAVARADALTRAMDSAVDDGKQQALDAVRDVMRGTFSNATIESVIEDARAALSADDTTAEVEHRGSCRVYYAERVCTCGADDTTPTRQTTMARAGSAVAALIAAPLPLLPRKGTNNERPDAGRVP